MSNDPETQIADDIEDLEVCVAEGRKPRKVKHYRIRIDREKYTVDSPTLTGREILELAGKIPAASYGLHQRNQGGGRVEIELDDVVDFTEKGIERFTTIPLEQTEG